MNDKLTVEISDNEIVFSSGRRFGAHRGLIGINQDLQISEGYDGHIETEYDDIRENDYLSDNEKLSLAEPLSFGVSSRVRSSSHQANGSSQEILDS